MVRELLGSKRIGVTSLTFWGHVTSSVKYNYLIPRRLFRSYWWSFGTRASTLTVSEIFNNECDTMVDMTTSKQRSRSFILVPIDFSYVTS